MPTVKLRDGDITLYTRGDSSNWYAGYRLADGGRLQESLKTRNKAEAKERAIARYDEIKWRKKLGLTQDTVSLAQAADAWITHLEGEVAAGTRKIRTVLDYKPCAERYLKPFFADKAIDTITAQDIAKYRVWRRDYWIKGPGSLLKQIEYERDGNPSSLRSRSSWPGAAATERRDSGREGAASLCESDLVVPCPTALKAGHCRNGAGDVGPQHLNSRLPPPASPRGRGVSP
jgi:hypothetical protein